MLDQIDGPWRIVLSVLMFPLFFQGDMLAFVWGTEDTLALTLLKRVLLVLPALAIIFGSWLTILSALTIIVRQKRRQFASAIFVTWWDLGRAIFSYWGGLLRFVFLFLGWCAGLFRILILGVLLAIKDLIMAPLRLAGSVTQGYFKPGVPWPAVGMTLGWAILEAVIFTFVMTPLVSDVLSGLSGRELDGPGLRIPLFLTFIIFVLGSYAVLESFGNAVKEREVAKIVNYGLIELIVAMVEVVFLYREFVDALVPWFAQHAGDDFSLGVVGTLGIAAFVWMGIRAMTWFLFGASGVPVLMAIIQRTGIEEASEKKGLFRRDEKAEERRARDVFVFLNEAIDRIKKDLDWVRDKGDELLSAFIMPPLQIVAACINFCTLCLNASYLFELPFKSYRDIMDARALLVTAKKSLVDKD